MKHLHTFEGFLSESVNSMTVDKIINIVNDATKRNETVTIEVKGKTYEIAKVLFKHMKTVEFKLVGTGQIIKLKDKDLVTIK